MLALDHDQLGILLRALALGVFGGAAIMLVMVYSRRGPLIYAVYAALLVCVALMLSQFSPTGFGVRFAAVLIAVVVATFMSLVAVIVRGGRQRRRLEASGVAMAPGSGPPWWGMPLVSGSLLVVSAGVAFILR